LPVPSHLLLVLTYDGSRGDCREGCSHVLRLKSYTKSVFLEGRRLRCMLVTLQVTGEPGGDAQSPALTGWGEFSSKGLQRGAANPTGSPLPN
jgi:hypothetical protein